MYDDSTGAAQKAIKASKQLMATSSAISILTGMPTDNVEESCLAQFASDIKHDLLMPGISNLSNTVALVRFFELSVQISLLSEPVFTAVSKEPLEFVLANFFELDALTQIAIMDFMVNFDRMPWTGAIIAPFLQKVFANFKDDHDMYGLV
jgi:hypothetical protein